MCIRNGRRNGLLLILIALLVYAACLRWADQLELLALFDLPAVVIIACELTGIIGAVMVIAAMLPRPRPELRPAGTLPIMGIRRRKRAERQRKAGTKFSSLPPFGLFCLILLPGLMLMMVLITQGRTLVLSVHSIKDASQIQPFPGFEPLIVHVDLVSLKKREAVVRYRVNAQETPLKDLGHALVEKLRYRPDKVVFVQADMEVEYQSVISAVDAAKGTGAAVVLVTSAGTKDGRSTEGKTVSTR